MTFMHPWLRHLHALRTLPCAGPCSRPGPHPTFPTRSGGIVAICAECQAQVGQDAGEDLCEGFQVFAPAGVAA